MTKIAPYYKAVAGALLAAISALVAGLVDGNLDTVEWLTALAALIVAGGAVFSVPNVPTEPPAAAQKPRRR